MTAKNKHTKGKDGMKELFSEGLGALRLEEGTRCRIWEKIETCMAAPDKTPEAKDSESGNRLASFPGGLRKTRFRRLWIPAVCCIGALCFIGVGMGIDRLLLMGGGSLLGEVTELGTVSSGSDTDIHVIPAESSFILNGKRYEQVSSGSAQIWGKPLPSTVSEESLGAAVGIISGSGKLNGETVYTYAPAGGEALVAVSLDGKYRLYAFSNFLSYEENGDEDAEKYLKVYGAQGPDDFLSVELLEYPDETTEHSLNVLDEEKKERFYNLFSGLQEKSSEYFSALSSYGAEGTWKDTASLPQNEASSFPAESFTAVFGPDGASYIPADSFGESLAEGENTAASHSPAGEGSHALDDSVCVRITFRSGLMRDFWYYPHIGFLSRFEVTPDLQALLESCGAPAG
ncbi:MAG: hypothetical protein ACLU62_05220 [Hydrogeniiclostridium sp.]